MAVSAHCGFAIFVGCTLLGAILSACTSQSVMSVEMSRDTTGGISYSLPRALLHLKAAWDGDEESLPVVTFGNTVFEPDPAAGYLLKAEPSVWANDEFTFDTSNGLLIGVNASNEDQTGAALQAVVGIAAQALKGATIAKVGETSDVTKPEKPFNVSVYFDPFDPASVDVLEDVLADVGLTVVVIDPPIGESNASASIPECEQSVCYRVPVAVTIVVEGAQHTFPGLRNGFRAMIPDVRRTYGLDIRRAACIDADTQLTLTSGMLTKVFIMKPSEVVGCLNIPLEVLKSIVAVPGELLKFESENLEAERRVLDLERELIDSTAALAAARAAQSD